MNDKKCMNCASYTGYYTKGYSCFLREKLGKCSKHDKIVDGHELCEYWRRKIYSHRRKAVALRTLDEALANIALIKQILAEEAEEG